MLPILEGINRKVWLVKFAPFRTSWAEIVRAGVFTMRGVRSPAARKHLRAMRRSDSVLFYHSQNELAIVGRMEVVRESYPDPTSADPQWLTCDFAPVETLCRPVPLGELRRHRLLTDFTLLRQPRLAVMPVTAAEFAVILQLASEAAS